MEARYSAPIQTGPGAQSASCTMGTGIFRGLRRTESEVDHLSQSNTYNILLPLWAIMVYSKVTFYIIQENHTCVYTEGRKSHDIGCFTKNSRCFGLDLSPGRSRCADTPRNPISSRQTTNSEIVRCAFLLFVILPLLSLFPRGYEQESKPQFS